MRRLLPLLATVACTGPSTNSAMTTSSPPIPKEALERKARSIARLEAEGVPFIDHLPVIETEEESQRRSVEEVAQRAMALSLVAAKGEGLGHARVASAIDELGLAPYFTPDERAFLDDAEPSEEARAKFTWRYEAYWTLLWALGYVDDLGRPDRFCDAGQAVKLFLEQGPKAFVAKAKLRPQAELLDAADLIYRYHWAVVDARLRGREPPAGLSPGVVSERHHALNWLIGYRGASWDQVSTDT